MPINAIELLDGDYHKLQSGLAKGKQIINVDGYPMLSEPLTPLRTHASLLSDVAAKRWQVETNGITVTGTQIKTDRESQAQLISAYTSLKGGLIADTQWKAADGSFTLVTLAEIEPVAKAVVAHVRACFAAERSHNDAITLLQTQAELDAYDIHTGWPPNSQ